MLDIKKMYLDWLDENITQGEISKDIIEINLPFLDFENDFLDVYVVQKDGEYTVRTDFCKDELKDFSFVCKNKNELPCYIQNIVNYVLRKVIQ